MSEQTMPAEAITPPRASLLDRPLSSFLILNLETLAWFGLLLLTVVARFYDLGVRAMSHDESLHTIYAYYLFDHGDYTHNPMMHGPLKFHLTALSYLLFGHNDYSSRIIPALLGSGMVFMAWLYRPYLGRIGAWIAGLLICVSPSLLFHSRYIRDDIFIEFFAMVWAYGAFRYVETRHVRWLYWMSVAMAFGCVGMEANFITGAIFGTFLIALLFWPALQSRLFLIAAPLLLGGGIWFWLHEKARTLSQQAKPMETDANQAQQFQDLMAQSNSYHIQSLVVLGIGVLVALGLLFVLMKRRDWSAIFRNPVGDAAILMLTLVLPYTSPFLHSPIDKMMGWTKIDWQNAGSLMGTQKVVYALLVLMLAVLAAVVAWIWLRVRASNETDFAATRDDLPAEGRFTFSHWVRMMAIFWVLDILFFTTFLTNVQNGLASGIVGSLGYWLSQQEVERGSQPEYYYLMIGWLYEYCPLILTICGSWLLARWLWWGKESEDFGELSRAVKSQKTSASSVEPSRVRSQKSKAAAQESVEIGEGGVALRGMPAVADAFVVFTLWWAVLAFVAYTVAGEKMPWLYTHIATPICLFGGWWLGNLISGIDWSQARRHNAFWLIAAAPALLLLTVMVVYNMPKEFSRQSAAISDVMQWLVMLLFWFGLVWFMSQWIGELGWQSGGRLAGVGIFSLLLILNARTSFMLTYLNYDYATEYLVYAHGGPDIKRALSEIDMISERTVGDRNIVVAYDDDSSWPLTWYMRMYPNARFYGAAPNADITQAAVVIVGPKNRDKVLPYVERDYIKRVYRLVWWPDMDYFNMTWERLWNAVADPVQRERIWQIFFYRRHRDTNDYSKFRDLAHWPSQHEFDMWVKRDVAAEIWDLGVAPTTGSSSSGPARSAPTVLNEIDVTAIALYNGAYNNVPLNKPRAVAVAPDGNRLIADSDNHRIVVLDAAGNFTRTFGSFCELGKGEAGGCVDPDGAGPLQLGDGQFNQPWGVVADGAGNIYVADTWNGRIQVFDNAGSFLRKWGVFNTTNGDLNGDPLILFGPRGITMGADGTLLVTDTGNKRIVQYTPDGQVVNRIGGGGLTPGALDEPTSITLDPTDGSYFVADAWNRRLQKFGADLQFQAEWPVAGWESKEIFHKPYVAVAPNGDVYASDPQHNRIFVYNKAGGVKATFGSFGPEPNHFSTPNGLAIDAANSLLLVADADNNRVMAMPLVP